MNHEPSANTSPLNNLSLCKNTLGVPVGVNQILFSALTTYSMISVLSPREICCDENETCPLPSCAKFRKNPRNTIVIITGAKIDNRFLFLGLKNLSKSELRTTETELIAIARPANSGLSVSHRDARIPHAIGIQRTL